MTYCIRQSLTLLFLVCEATLAVLIQLIGGRVCAYLSFGAIVLAACGCLLRVTRTPVWLLTQLALLCTVGADYCLVYQDPPLRLAGMIFFLFVQACYFIRIQSSLKGKVATVSWVVRASVTALGVLLPILVLGKGADALAIVSIVYILHLLTNIVYAYLARKSCGWLFAIGLTLFIFCDIFVGMGMIEAYLPLKEGTFLYFLAYPGFNAAWVFYVPAQALLAISTPIRNA